MGLLAEARAKTEVKNSGTVDSNQSVGLLAEARARKNPANNTTKPQTDAGIKNDSNGSINSSSVNNVSSGVDEGIAKKIDNALLNIPGVPALTEFAAGTGRSVAGFLDFLGPDNINALLELSGREERSPTFSGLAPDKGSFDDSLLGKAAGTAGEIAPVALGIGQALKTLATKLPGFSATEAAGSGTLRSLGSTTAKQDVVGGSLAGVGQEVGREVGGEDGALVGSVLAPLTPLAIPIKSAKQAAVSLLKKAAPNKETLKSTASAIYKSLDDSGISVPARSFDALADDITGTLKKEGAAKELTDKAITVMKIIEEAKGTPKTLQQLDTLRKQAKTAADSLDRSDARLGVIAVNKIDDYMDNLGAEIATGADAGKAYRSARDLWQRVKKTELLDQALVNAENQASGFENGIRTQFRQLLKKIDTGKQKGFTTEERESIKKVVQGTNAGNIAKFLGKFGVLDGVTSRSLTTLGGVGLAGAATGSSMAAAAVPLIGQVSGALAQRMTLNNAKMAQSIIRAGKNGNLISNIYIKATPAAERTASELAELFIKNEVPLQSISLSAVKPLISDAAIIAALAKFNDSKQEEN
jgi:hypothetical protein